MKKIISLISSFVLITSLSVCPVCAENTGEQQQGGVYLECDTNGDAIVSAADMASLLGYLIGKDAVIKNGDVNGDGKINVMDLILLKKYMLNDGQEGTEEIQIPVVSSEIINIEEFGENVSKTKQPQGDESKAVFIQSYDEMKTFIDEIKCEDSVRDSINKTYNEEFFENYSLAAGIIENRKFDVIFKTAVIREDTLFLNFSGYNGRYCYEEPSTCVFVVFDKKETQNKKVGNTVFNNEVKSTDSLNIDTQKNILWSHNEEYKIIESNKEFAEFMHSDEIIDYSSGIPELISEYDDEFFVKNKLIVITSDGTYSYASGEYDDNILFVTMSTGGRYDCINLITLPREISDGRQIRVDISEMPKAAKPVIYLYPEEETKVSVSVNLNGEFTCVYPEFTDRETSTWTVTAKPDGTLYTEDGSEYSYLFWEGTEDAYWDMSEGFVVKGCETMKFLKEQLPKMGLTPKEYNDFIVYWLPEMQYNEYNYITFQTDRYTDGAVLSVTPEADSVLRVFMAYEPVNAEKAEYLKNTTTEPEFEKFERKGFTVVEWGGTKINR